MQTVIDKNRKEDIFVLASFESGQNQFRDIKCKIYLPERIYEKPIVLFLPSHKDAEIINKSSHCKNFKAEAKGYYIAADEVNYIASDTIYWDALTESAIYGEPQNLQYVQVFKPEEISKPEEIYADSELVFLISKCSLLTPNSGMESSYKGDIKRTRYNKFKFKLTNKIQVEFEPRYKTKTSPNKDLIQWSYLCAVVKSKVPQLNLKEIQSSYLEPLDDLLAIASFAARNRTCCLGWQSTSRQMISKFFRGYYSYPEQSDKEDRSYTLITPIYFEDFLPTAYARFMKFEDKPALRQALYSSINNPNTTVESSFLRKFSAIEAIILSFKRKESFEFIVPESDWKILKGELRAFIKSKSGDKLDKSSRELIYKKLEELNRVPLKDAFQKFCSIHEVNLEDLWPVFTPKGEIGLNDIRNRLSHGDALPRNAFEPLIYANEQMGFILERLILNVLGWDIRDSCVEPSFLRRTAYSCKHASDLKKQLNDNLLNAKNLNS